MSVGVGRRITIYNADLHTHHTHTHKCIRTETNTEYAFPLLAKHIRERIHIQMYGIYASTPLHVVAGVCLLFNVFLVLIQLALSSFLTLEVPSEFGLRFIENTVNRIFYFSLKNPLWFNCNSGELKWEHFTIISLTRVCWNLVASPTKLIQLSFYVKYNKHGMTE